MWDELERINGTLNDAEEKISEVDIAVEITQNYTQSGVGKDIENKENISNLRDNFKQCNTHNWSPQRKKERKTEKYLKTYSNLMKTINLQTQEAQWTSSTRNVKKTTLRHIMLKLVRKSSKKNRFVKKRIRYR